MTTTARVAATTAASVAYTFSVAAGGTSGKAPRAQGITARLTKEINVIAIIGPIDARINKPVTLLSAEVVEYT